MATKRKPTQSRSTSAGAAAKRPEASDPARVSEGRVEEYRRLADTVSHGVGAMTPALLTGQARREHVRATLREDHRARIQEQATGADAKFEKLAGSLFSFFRGTALLFYRDMAGADARMPTVLVLGDVHPGNFGIMPNADNVPIFSVNDFDETFYAPFTWDLKRAAVGFMLAAEEEGGCGQKTRRKIVKRFISGYVDGMRRYAASETEKRDEFRIDNSPPILRRLFEQAEQSRRRWLEEKYLDETARGFRADEELTPISSRRDEFQRIVDRLVEQKDLTPPPRAGELRVKDVAIRHGQGTASLGLPRYYVMIEGPARDGTDDLILEIKRARRSALEGLVPPSGFNAGATGDRIAHGQAVHLARGDVFYGSVEIDGVSFMTRERAPFREDMDLDELSKKEWKAYAEICGQTLAQAHALSDDAGQIDYDVDPHIVEAMQPVELFIDDILAFAAEAAERARRDHAAFRKDHALGAFRRVDMIYR